MQNCSKSNSFLVAIFSLQSDSWQSMLIQTKCDWGERSYSFVYFHCSFLFVLFSDRVVIRVMVSAAGTAQEVLQHGGRHEGQDPSLLPCSTSQHCRDRKG